VDDKKRMTDEEYEALSDVYAKIPPKVSGKPGFLTNLHEKALVTKLLPPEYARIINMKAQAMSMTPSEVIQDMIKEQMAGNV
jgi:hypothetical protein